MKTILTIKPEMDLSPLRFISCFYTITDNSNDIFLWTIQTHKIPALCNPYPLVEYIKNKQLWDHGWRFLHSLIHYFSCSWLHNLTICLKRRCYVIGYRCYYFAACFYCYYYASIKSFVSPDTDTMIIKFFFITRLACINCRCESVTALCLPAFYRIEKVLIRPWKPQTRPLVPIPRKMVYSTSSINCIAWLISSLCWIMESLSELLRIRLFFIHSCLSVSCFPSSSIANKNFNSWNLSASFSDRIVRYCRFSTFSITASSGQR